MITLKPLRSRMKRLVVRVSTAKEKIASYELSGRYERTLASRAENQPLICCRPAGGAVSQKAERRAVRDTASFIGLDS